MIIVSQEKDAILNFDNVIGIRTAIDIESNKETRIAIDTIEGERYYIARYSTEERTKEVIADIYMRISKRKTVYEMPKER